MFPGVDASTSLHPLSQESDAVNYAREHGYVVLNGVVSEAAVSALKARVVDLCVQNGLLDSHGAFVPSGLPHPSLYSDPRWIALQQSVVPDPAFMALGDHPAILQFLADVLGEPVRSRCGDICRIAPAGSPVQTTRPHQDDWYLNGPPLAWTAWFPLDPCPPDHGGLGLLPKTHERGLRPHQGQVSGEAGCETAPDECWHMGTVNPGDVVVFHCRTVHRAWHNLSPHAARLSVDFRYLPTSIDLTTLSPAPVGS